MEISELLPTLTKPQISLQVASPVNHFPKLDEEKERQMTATSGLKCLELYESLNRRGSLLKTCVAYLLGTTAWYSNKCALTWKAKVTKSNRLLFQLSPSMRHTEGIESGLLPTVRAREGNSGDKEAGIAHGLKKGYLDAKIAMLKTPSSSEHVGGWKVTDKYWEAKAPKLKMRDQVGRKTGLKLQPAFVEWMMGFPEGWTEIPDSKLLEMRLSRKLQKKL